MKLNKKIIILIILTFLIIIFYKANYKHIASINMNWDLKLPIPNEELYYLDSGPSFFGDGYTYMVVKYTSKKKHKRILNNFKWNSTISLDETKEIEELVNRYEIDETYKLNIDENDLYIHIIGEDEWSELYLIYSIKEQTMYIIEDII